MTAAAIIGQKETHSGIEHARVKKEFGPGTDTKHLFDPQISRMAQKENQVKLQGSEMEVGDRAGCQGRFAGSGLMHWPGFGAFDHDGGQIVQLPGSIRKGQDRVVQFCNNLFGREMARPSNRLAQSLDPEQKNWGRIFAFFNLIAVKISDEFSPSVLPTVGSEGGSITRTWSVASAGEWHHSTRPGVVASATGRITVSGSPSVPRKTGERQAVSRDLPSGQILIVDCKDTTPFIPRAVVLC